jgi:Ca-activated chloride channel family protein
MRKTLKINFIVLIAFGLCPVAYGQNKIQQKVPEKTRILFVLDGSGSMEAAWDNKQSRMDIAKQILTQLVDSLRVNADLELALRVYGHQSARSLNNCQDSKLEVPFAAKNHNAIISKIKGIKPRGVTPITFAVSQAAKDFPSNTGYRNILILITDGVESCGGDPCSVSIELQRKGVFLRPFIIGLGLKGGQALDCMGRYIDSQDANAFNKILNKSIESSLAKTTVSIELLNGQDKPVETNINVSFINSTTGISAYEFVHYRDRLGRPDSVQVDPVLSYDILVNTVPPVLLKNNAVTSGEHNVIRVSVPQGTLTAKSEGRGNPFALVVRQKGKSETLNQQRGGESFRYLEGEYEVETVTLPRRIFTVNLKADQTETITLPSTGLINLNTLTRGIGSLFEILESGETKWVFNLNENETFHSLNLLPGKYKVAFRARQAGGSKYTAVKNFEVRSGQTQNLNMFN